MQPLIRTIASRHPVNLNSTPFHTRPSLLLTRLLPSLKHHTSTSSKNTRKEPSSQARAKARYEHVYTTFHEKNGYTAPIFKTFLADMASRAGYTVTEKNQILDPTRDCSDKTPLSKNGAADGKTLSKEEEDDERETKSEKDEELAYADDGDTIINHKSLDQQYRTFLSKNPLKLLRYTQVLRSSGGSQIKKEEEEEEESESELKIKIDRQQEKEEEEDNALDILQQTWILQGAKKVWEKKHDDDEEEEENVIEEAIWWDPGEGITGLDEEEGEVVELGYGKRMAYLSVEIEGGGGRLYLVVRRKGRGGE